MKKKLRRATGWNDMSDQYNAITQAARMEGFVFGVLVGSIFVWWLLA